MSKKAKPRVRPKNTHQLPTRTETKTTAKPVKKKESKFQVSTTTMTRGIQPIKLRNLPKIPEPKVYYTPEAFQKMRHIVATCELEVGWMCLVDDLGDNRFVIYEVFVPHQLVTAITTEISSEAMAELALELIDANHDPAKLYGWFHSHVDMNVNPSSQDERQVEEFVEDCPVFIRGIWNKKGDEKVDVYFRDQGIAFTNVRTQILLPQLPDEVIKELDNAIKNNVEEEIILPNRPHFGSPYFPSGRGQTNRTAYTFPDDDIDDYYYEAYTNIKSTTGYSVQWDETTPIRNRPTGWEKDPLYLSISYEVEMDEEQLEMFDQSVALG